jgi:hypothetical protein
MFKKNRAFLIIVSLVLLILQYVPFYYHQNQSTKNRVYLGAERYTPDYYVYLYYINQGVLGKNLVVNFYTNEPHAGSLVHIEYLLMGKVGNLFKLPISVIFYGFRSLFLVVYVLISFWFIGLFIKNTLVHRLAFLLSFFWGGLFWPEISQNGINLKSYFDFYQTPDIFNRLTFEPHKLIGMSLMLILLALVIKILNSQKTYKAIACVCLTITLTGFLHGVTAIGLIFTMIFYLLFDLLISILNKNRSLSSLFRSFSIPAVFIFAAALPLFYWQYVFSQNHVWYAVSLWERNFAKIDMASNPVWTVVGFIFTLGPLVVLGLIGIKKFLADHKKFGLLLFSFLLSNVFLFFVGYMFLGTTKHRYHQTPNLVGWSIMATYGIQTIALALQKVWNKKNLNFLLVAFYCLLIFMGIPNALQGLNRQLYQFGSPPNLDLMGYPPKKTYEALVWMKNSTNMDDVILSLPTIGQIIPFVPGRKVVVGDYVHTYKYFEKLPLVEKFYSGLMSQDEVKSFLEKENVHYVFWSFEEKNKGNLDVYGNLLKEVFSNKDAVVYEVMKSPKIHKQKPQPPVL